jgi:ATP-dependent Lon protease
MGLFNKKDNGPKNPPTDPQSSDINNTPAPVIPKELPVIGLRNTVIYPFTVVPVLFEDDASLAALQEAQKKDRMIGAFALKKEARHRLEVDMEEGVEEEGSNQIKSSNIQPNELYTIGTACLIHRVMPVTGRKGAMVVLQGLGKVRSVEFTRHPAYISSLVEVVNEQVKETKAVRALMKNALGTAQKIIQNTPYLPQELQMALVDLNDPLRLVYLLATLIRFNVEEGHAILTENSVEVKLKRTAALLSKELEQIELGGKIVSNVKKEFGRMSRDAFLRQQLKEIQRELGEDSENQQEVVEYRKKIKKNKLPESIIPEINREIDRLEKMHPQSSEYQVVRTYLDWVFDIPWYVADEKGKKLSLGHVEEVLDADHYGLKQVKKRILEYLAVRELNKKHRGPILCFVGPPGVGKTSLGKSIARALNRKFVRVSFGGLRDEAEIRGHRRTYVGAMPGRILQGIRRAGAMDPIFMLDEVDKIGNDFRGDPSSALLEVLDPEQNSTFHDNYLDLDYDLSRVLFIATANVLDTIQPPLRDRMEIIELSGYTDEEKKFIALKHLWPKVLESHGLKKKDVKINEELLELVINQYTMEAGVRGLEKELAKIARRLAFLRVQDQKKSTTINEPKIREILGARKVYQEVGARTAMPGVATGLAVTGVGGEILFIEANKMYGGKQLSLTGSLGEVMKESAKTALSLVRSRADKFGIPEDFFKKYDIHVHVPAGAIPKDGPSAGTAMTTAIVSLLTDRKVRNDVAMTGEITLSGLVLPIGGVKEKVLAAKRAGITTVILPEKNENDVKEIEAHLIQDMNFKYAENIEQVIDEALVK